MMHIVTATFDRAYVLDRLYKSLLAQTTRRFQWTVVDDGSRDNTLPQVDKWRIAADFPILVLSQENAGKFAALNRAFDALENWRPDELVTVVDSDDFLLPDAVEAVLAAWEMVKGDQGCCGLVAHRCRSNLARIGSEFPRYLQRANLFELYERHGVTGDKWVILRTAAVREFRYPIFCGERRIAPSVMYNAVCAGRDLYILDRALRVGDYLRDGITRNLLGWQMQSPKSTAYSYNQKLGLSKRWICKYYYAAKYVAFCLLARDRMILRSASSKVMVTAAFPVGLVLYVSYRARMALKGL